MATPNKNSPRRRLAQILKQKSSKIESVDQFRRKLHSVIPLITNHIQLDAWLDAREQMGLLNDPDVKKVADEIIRVIYLIEEERMGINNAKTKPRVDNTDALNRREEIARNNVRPVGYRVTPTMRSRMVAAFDKLLDKEIQEVWASRDG